MKKTAEAHSPRAVPAPGVWPLHLQQAGELLAAVIHRMTTARLDNEGEPSLTIPSSKGEKKHEKR